ncbi:MAG: ISAs1 family transposase [Planctomycetaceae bacterium]|nr:ISAs1 family transposase [Planctomycetaceae bacterium]
MQQQRHAERDRVSTIEKGHGRVERRTLTSTTALNQHLNWPGVQQVCRLERERTIRGQRTSEVAYYVTSLPRSRAGAEQLLRLCRGHWGTIENRLHYVRDEALGEDRSTIFRGHAPQNLAALRNAALNWLRQERIDKITATLRSFARNPLRLFTKLGYRN